MLHFTTLTSVMFSDDESCTCRKCGMSLNSPASRGRHEKFNLCSKQCSRCFKIFTATKTLEQHMNLNKCDDKSPTRESHNDLPPEINGSLFSAIIGDGSNHIPDNVDIRDRFYRSFLRTKDCNYYLETLCLNENYVRGYDLIKNPNLLGVHISSNFSVLRPKPYIRLFLYFDQNIKSTFLAKLYIDQNFTSTNKKSRFEKKAEVSEPKFSVRSKEGKVQKGSRIGICSKYRKRGYYSPDHIFSFSTLFYWLVSMIMTFYPHRVFLYFHINLIFPEFVYYPIKNGVVVN